MAGRWPTLLTALVSAALVGCGGGGGGASSTDSAADRSATAAPVTATASDGTGPAATVAAEDNNAQIQQVRVPANTIIPTNTYDAVRLANQATFGPTEALVAEIKSAGPSAWLISQMTMPAVSRYTSGKDGEVNQSPKEGSSFCDGRDVYCWRDYFTADPLLWDFYRNATQKPDQLRQRVAFALQQMLVISNIDTYGTYGFRNYHNTLLDLSFGNYRDILKKVTLSPVMGDYLNNVNNSRQAPNENYARELLQLFAIGPCRLNINGSLYGGKCTPTYTNDIVRSYAFALTGWTYPVGGTNGYGCLPYAANCRYYNGDMVPIVRYHDTNERKLLSNIRLAPGHTAPEALERVLDSLMLHPNMAPFVAKQLIQKLVTSNPGPGYVQRVADAFNAGRYGDFGTGKPGDMAATIAAILLDNEARKTTTTRSAGKLREPVLFFTGMLRALNGQTDGDALAWWWGKQMRQHVFRAPSVFNFYPPDNPVSGTTLVGPEFFIYESSTAMERLNFITYLIDWGGSPPSSAIPNALGTKIDVTAFLSDADDAAKLVDRMSLLTLGQPLQGPTRSAVINAVSYWTTKRDSVNWKKYRVNTAAYFIFASPQYQVQR